MKSKWESEKENLKNFILIDALSYEEIGKKYNCTGGNIKKVALRLGIKLKPRRFINKNETFNKGIYKNPDSVCLNCGKKFHKYTGSTNKYCCHQCQFEYQHKYKYELLKKADLSIMRANYSPRLFKEDIIKEQKGVCAICGMKAQWNNKPLIFIIDHIDGNAANNKRDNLRCICPNCDSQLDTYKSKNKNGARSYYRYHRFNNEIKIKKQ